MTHNKLLMKSLPLVASVLARKYGVRVHIGGKTACTDGNVIQLPTLPLECDETLIGLARGYIDHEAAHIRDTRFDWLRLANLTPLEHHIWNTFEDWRVEHKLTAIFPGCRQNFNWLIRHIFENADSPNTNPAAAILDWLLLSVRAWDVPTLETQRDATGSVVEHAYPGLMERLQSVLRRVRNYSDSTQDCILYAREVASILREYAKGISACKSPQTKEEIAKKNNHKGRAGGQVSASGDSAAGRRLRRLLQAEEKELPKGTGEQLAHRLAAEKPHEMDSALNIAQPGNKRITDLTPEDVAATRAASIALRTRLQGLLQAQVLTRSRAARNGRLDPGRLHRLAVADPRVFRKHEERPGLDTAVHILLDCSGSMRKRIKLTTQTCHAVASALDSIKGISMGVSAFPAGTSTDGGNENPDGPTICQILAHGQRMHNGFGLNATGCTPLGEALWWVLQQMLPLAQSRKLILTLTDGNPDSFPIAEQAIETGTKLGFEIYGLGINSDAITKLLPNHSRTINELNDLAPAMFNLLQHALLRI